MFSVVSVSYFLIVSFQLDSAGVDADIQREYARQREHLERSVASLRKKLAKDSEIHRADNVRIMQVRGLTCAFDNQVKLFLNLNGFCSRVLPSFSMTIPNPEL